MLLVDAADRIPLELDDTTWVGIMRPFGAAVPPPPDTCLDGLLVVEVGAPPACRLCKWCKGKKNKNKKLPLEVKVLLAVP